MDPGSNAGVLAFGAWQRVGHVQASPYSGDGISNL